MEKLFNEFVNHFKLKVKMAKPLEMLCITARYRTRETTNERQYKKKEESLAGMRSF
jgi:hypothetical protein